VTSALYNHHITTSVITITYVCAVCYVQANPAPARRARLTYLINHRTGSKSFYWKADPTACPFSHLVTILASTVYLSIYLSLHFNGHFPGRPGLPGTRMSPFWILLELRMMEVVVDNWSYKMSPPTNQHPTFYRPDVLPVAQPTVSEH